MDLDRALRISAAGMQAQSTRLRVVAENLALGRTGRRGLVSWRRLHAEAERVLQAGAHAVTPSGKPFTENSIGAAIAQRALMEQLRSTGDILGGPKPFDRNDRSRFLQALDEIIQKERRKRG